MPILPTLWLRKKAIFGVVALTVMIGIVVTLNISPWSHPLMAGDIPLPFGEKGSTLHGALTKFGQRNGIDVFEVSFDHSEVSEHLLIDKIYLVHVSNTSSASDVPFDLALTLSGTGGHLLDYYGYRYSDTVATLEKRDIKAFRFKDRFSGQFFMSQTARKNDPKKGNLLSTFETANQISFLRTDNINGAVRLDPAGALYVIVVNEVGGADIAVRDIVGCGNKKLELAEQCDDGNTNDVDNCRNDCTIGLPIPLDAPLSNTGISLMLKQIAGTDSTSSLSSRIPLVRFSASASDPILLQRLSFVAQSGSFLRMHSYRIWQDTDKDGITDAAISRPIEASGGLVRFQENLNWTGALVLSQTGTIFELKADAVPGPQFTIRVGFALEKADVVVAKRTAGTFPLLGIQRNGECTEKKCSMAIKTAASFLWTLGGDSLCGNGVQNNAEQCDDGNFVDGDKCSRFCQIETYPIHIQGRLVDQLSGKAISGAYLESAYAYSPPVVRTDTEGNFAFDVRTDFIITDGQEKGQSDNGGSWYLRGSCYQDFAVSLQKGNGRFISLVRSAFDQEESSVEIGKSQDIDLGTVSLYPSAHIMTKTDVPAGFDIYFKYKNLTGFNGAGNSNFTLEHTLSAVLPVDYDIFIRFTTGSGQIFDSGKFRVPADATCKTVHLEHDSKMGDSVWSVGENLFVTSKAMAETDTVVRNQKDVVLQRFEARAQSDIVLTRAVFDAQQGSLANAKNYALWVDTDDNGIVDTILEDGVSAGEESVVFQAFSSGDGFFIPNEKSIVFEVHADISPSAAPGTFKLQLKFATSNADYLSAKRASNGKPLLRIQTDGVCDFDCGITVLTIPSTVFTIRSQGDLFVTKDSTPVRSRQLLGGTLGDAILRLQFHAEYEPVSPILIRFTAVGEGVSSIDSLELFRVGETEYFAVATKAACSAYPAQFCTGTQSDFRIPKGQNVGLLVRPRMKSDTDGAISGDAITLSLEASDSVIAVGDISSNSLLINDANASEEGRIFIGSATPGAHHPITGNKNIVVLSKIASITNADPNADGTAVPSGTQRSIGQFKFSTLAAANSKNGINKWTLTDIMFDIEAINVEFDKTSFRFANKQDLTTVLSCDVIDDDGSDLLHVGCFGIDQSPINTSIDPASDETFVLVAEILRPQVDPTKSSSLQVSLSNFTNALVEGLASGLNHVRWIDLDAAPDTGGIFWIEYPDTIVRGTVYGDNANNVPLLQFSNP